MFTSGVILDQYDDSEASVLKSTFGLSQNMPAQFKTASIDASVLPDESFALIIEDSGVKLRKYAMADKDTTLKSAFYFLKCGAKLPEEAQKTAAVNLTSALLDFGVQPPQKLRELAKTSAVPKGLMDWSQERKVNKESAGSVRMDRMATMVHRAKKKMSKQSNIVDTTGRQPSGRIVEVPLPTNPDMYALVKENSAYYPIDTMDRLLDAVTYFDRYGDNFSPEDRREYCTKVAARADQLCVPIPQEMRDYASFTKSAHALAYGLYERSQSIPETSGLQVLLSEIAKEASALPPEMLVEVLAQFDKEAGIDQYWDRGVPNPVLSVYKCATNANDDDLLWEEGNDRLSSAQLKDFATARGSRELMQSKFSYDLVDKFLEDPVTIFQSLPDPHKIEIARLASDNSDGRDLPHRVVDPNSAY